MIKVKVEEKKCIGCGGCIIICPEVFEYSREIKAQIKEKFRIKIKDKSTGLIKNSKVISQIMLIESLCPTYAITTEKISQGK